MTTKKSKPKKERGGNCYHAALGYVLTESLAGRPKTLVHGVLVRPDGVEMGHAWVEYTTTEQRVRNLPDGGYDLYTADAVKVYDRTTDETHDRDVFVALYNVVYAVRYTAREAGKLVEQFGHMGPWDATVNAARHA